MIYHRISDWNNAYSRGPNISGGTALPEKWVEPARAYRKGCCWLSAETSLRYGDRERNAYDLEANCRTQKRHHPTTNLIE